MEELDRFRFQAAGAPDPLVRQFTGLPDEYDEHTQNEPNEKIP